MLSENDVLQLVEVKINKWAETIIDQYRIKSGSYKIYVKANKEQLKPTRYGYVIQDGSYHEWMENDNSSVVRAKRTYIVKPNDLLHSHSSLLAEVVNGTIVQITLYVPLMKKEDDIQTQLNKTIKRMKHTVKGLFKYLSNPRLHRDSELFNPTIVGDVVHEYVMGEDNTKVWRKRKNDPQVINDRTRSEFAVTRKRQVTFTHKETGIHFTAVDTTGKRTDWELEQEAWAMCAMLIEEYDEDVNSIEDLIKKGQQMVRATALVPMHYYNTLVHPLFD